MGLPPGCANLRPEQLQQSCLSKAFQVETVALEGSVLRQKTCYSTIWRTAGENAYVEGFQGIQADRFAGEQFIWVSGTIS